jgi:hypothetical protein
VAPHQRLETTRHDPVPDRSRRPRRAQSPAPAVGSLHGRIAVVTPRANAARFPVQLIFTVATGG